MGQMQTSERMSESRALAIVHGAQSRNGIDVFFEAVHLSGGEFEGDLA